MTRVVVHQDDVGMCHGANMAFVELSQLGTITCGSVMVPCPWFPEMAQLAAAEALFDLGVHLTLTSEKPHYRWAPLTRVGASSGLVDGDGYLWRDVASVRRHAHPEAVEAEFRAQIDRALAAGIDVTHLDAHMGAPVAPEFCGAYLRVAIEYRLPALLTTTLDGYGPREPHLRGTTTEQFDEFVAIARAAGLPLFDRVFETNFNRPQSSIEGLYEAMFGSLHGDVCFMALHPNKPGDIEVIEPDQFHVRTQEYELFRMDAYRSWLRAQPLEIIGMRQLRDEFRTDCSIVPS
jgi:chitin disaccharide deacetylase